MALVKKISLDKLVEKINAMPKHDDIEFFWQNFALIIDEIRIEFCVLDDDGEQERGAFAP